MSRLSAKARAQLPNTAFAYVNSKGQRRLPIHDEAHVRNALARFSQIKFEDDATRERPRKRLLTAAKEVRDRTHRVHHRAARHRAAGGESRGRDAVSRNLPTGQVTFLLTDIEDSTGLLRLVGDGYASLLGDVRNSSGAPSNALAAARSTPERTNSSPSSDRPVPRGGDRDPTKPGVSDVAGRGSSRVAPVHALARDP